MIDAKLHVDPAHDAAEIVVDLVGVDPFQHEFLKQVFASELSDSEDEKDAAHGKALGPQDIRLRFKMVKTGAAEDAKRIVAGRPTVAEEAAAKAKAAEEAKLKAEADASEQKRAEEQKVADEKAARDFELEKARVTGEAIGKAMAEGKK